MLSIQWQSYCANLCGNARVQSLGPPIYFMHRSYKQAPAIAGARDIKFMRYCWTYTLCRHVSPCATLW